MRPSHLALLIVLSTIWGSAFMLVKVTLEEVPPLTLVAGRLTGASLFLVGVLVVTGRRLEFSRRAWRAYAVLGIVNNVVPFILLAWGQQHIDSSLAAILVASMPLWTVILAHYWSDELLTVDRAAGVLLGFVGVLFLIGGDIRDVTEVSTVAQFAMLGGAFCYAAGTVYARRYIQHADSTVTAAGQTLVGAAIMAPIALAVDRPFDLDLTLKVGLAWVTLGLVASAVAYLVYFWLIRHITATQASMVAYLIPITAVFLGAFVLDEQLGTTTFAGLALIIAGVWVVNGGGAWVARRMRGDVETTGA